MADSSANAATNPSSQAFRVMRRLFQFRCSNLKLNVTSPPATPQWPNASRLPQADEISGVQPQGMAGLSPSAAFQSMSTLSASAAPADVTGQAALDSSSQPPLLAAPHSSA